ncbi:hypothetical protein A1O3_04787 [Capronia epimyces CBS 606.96]|uniref:Uncharacterized protein n=1 Tax=Capronia epimyces CBS 606.96 TaxID=1182542 RepID=W9Y3A4_9EURO|nr:uncharacterized protein A1O3_04787 [Capronia epimyces CBS 606.96]EXJ84120.1 hypothetical protein A1O3_04787 [Capronia epimyces CBS 606.96]
MSLALVSQVIGFISFAITLMTLLGVYRDLISTMRHADTLIPIMLGNLRQEIEAEKVLLRHRIREGDPYSVFPNPRARRKRRRQQKDRMEVAQLLESTINDLWQQFKNVERPFLIRDPMRAEQVQRGDYWGESDVDEKHSARPSGRRSSNDNRKKVKDRVGMAEAGLSSNQQWYYRTDLVHRFIW